MAQGFAGGSARKSCLSSLPRAGTSRLGSRRLATPVDRYIVAVLKLLGHARHRRARPQAGWWLGRAVAAYAALYGRSDRRGVA